MERNTLFPVFLKLEKLRVLIVGGGNVAQEKLNAVLGNSPKAIINIVSIDFSEEVMQSISLHNLPYEQRPFQETDCDNADVVIIAVNDPEASTSIYEACRKHKVLANVADKPSLCDFYLSSIVQKGSLKIAISTNGKSPTIAKRIKEVFQDAIPDELEEVLANLQIIRAGLSGDFSNKVKTLNQLTAGLATNDNSLLPKPMKSGPLLPVIIGILGIIVGYLLAKFS